MKVLCMWMCLIVAGLADNKELVDVIKDTILILQTPLRVTSLLCWNRNDLILLAKTMIKHQILVTPSKGNLTTYWPHDQQLFLLDLNCNSSEEILKHANEDNLFEPPFKWLIIGYSQQINIPLVKIFVRSKVYLIEKVAPKTYYLQSKYRIAESKKSYITNNIALWSNGSFDYYNKLVDSRNRSNLEGYVINASVVILTKEQESHLLDGRFKHINPATKVNYILTLHVFDFLNASGIFKIHRTWGQQNATTGIFDGMMYDLQFKQSEICGNPTVPAAHRKPYIDWIALTSPSILKFFFKAPPLPYVKNIYTLPFNDKVWLASFALIAVNPIIFYIISYWESSSKAFNKYEKSKNSVQRLPPNSIDMLQLQVGAICQQGSEAEPISVAGRIATISLFVAMLFLYTSYSANIVGLLQSTSDSIKTPEDLLESNIELGVEDLQYNRYFFKIATGETQKAILRKKIEPPGMPSNFMTYAKGMLKMRNEFFAFQAEGTTMYNEIAATFLDHEKCALTAIEVISIYSPYYGMRKNTTYGELFRVAITKIRERGISDRSYKRLYLKKPSCESSGGVFRSVSLLDCYAAFLVFGTGFVLSIAILLLEIIVYKTKMYKTRNDVIDIRERNHPKRINIAPVTIE